MKSIVTIVGARPQFVKAAAVSKAIAENTWGLKEYLIHTGQHFDRDMSDLFFEELSIPRPCKNLGIGGGGHGSNTGRMLERIEASLREINPEGVMVYGDTDSTLAGALAAAKIGIPVIHVEAGLRSYSKYQPEEINRRLTDHLAERCLVPTVGAKLNLEKEGIGGETVEVVGDVMADAARIFGKESRARQMLGFGNKKEEYILATIHRAENTDSAVRLESILSVLAQASERVIMPLHPRTKIRISEFGLDGLLERIDVLEPVGYLDMLGMIKGAAVVITDSGGLQKEAYLHGAPCVTIRDQTEWVELVSCGWNKLADVRSKEDMIEKIEQQKGLDRASQRPMFYGDGYASERIIRIIQGL